MKKKDLMNTTFNPRVYRLTQKMTRGTRGEISCSRCPYHRLENKSDFTQRSWKVYRKTQYK